MRQVHWISTLGLAAGLSGCFVDEEDGSLYIEAALPFSTDNCTALVGSESPLGEGAIDLAMAPSYVLAVRVVNNMASITNVNQFTPADARLDTTDVFLRRAVVQYRALDQISVDFPEELRIPMAATVKASGGESAVPIEILTAGMVQDLRTSPEFIIRGADGQVRPARSQVQLLAKVILQGETLDGKTVESNEFVFPLTVCNGCLIHVPPEAVSTSVGVQPNCLNIDLGEDGSGLPEVKCPQLVGQDTSVDCRICTLYAVDDFARQLCQPAF